MLPTLLLSAALSGPPLPSELTAQISPDRLRADIEKLVSFGTRHTLSDAISTPTRGIAPAREWIKKEIESYNAPDASGKPGQLQVSFEEWTQPPGRRVPTDTHMVNVVAVLPGTDPAAAKRRYYVVGHYDSRNSGDHDETKTTPAVYDPKGDSPGANDDGSGTACVMECARILAHHPLEATVVFLCTCGEEQGLYGAKHHAEAAKARGEDIRGVLSNDIIGDPSTPNGPSTPTLIRVFSEGIPAKPTPEQLTQIRNLAAESDSPSRQLARFIAEVAQTENTAVKPMLVFRPDRFLRGGDHSAFNESGFSAVRFTEVDEEFDRQHQDVRTESGRQYGDTAEFVDPVYLANVTRLNAATLIHLAMAPAAPAKVRIVTAKLENATTLRWEPSTEPDLAGYEVVWRDTTEPTWTHSKDFGPATEAHLDLNKDNVFFGVRAYDKQGYKSPVSFPKSPVSFPVAAKD
jgi:hypothetical protein